MLLRPLGSTRACPLFPFTNHFLATDAVLPETVMFGALLSYFVRLILVMIPTLLVISLVVFVISQLPPGDYLETMISELRAQGENVDPARIEFLRRQYG